MTKKKPTKFKYHYLLRMPMTEAVTFEEGGAWVPFEELTKNDGGYGTWRAAGRLIHSIRFAGGHEWDAVNGWRMTDISSTSGKGVTCRESKFRAEPPMSYKRVDKVPRGYPKIPPLSGDDFKSIHEDE
jgi:hypothetical protein